MIQLLWPTTRLITENALKWMASDALANETDIRKDPENISVEEAIDIVQQYGYATVSERILSKEEAEWEQAKKEAEWCNW